MKRSFLTLVFGLYSCVRAAEFWVTGPKLFTALTAGSLRASALGTAGQLSPRQAAAEGLRLSSVDMSPTALRHSSFVFSNIDTASGTSQEARWVKACFLSLISCSLSVEAFLP